MLEIILPLALFIIILLISFFLFKTLFKILAIFTGVLILGAIVSGVLLYIDGKTYVERLPTNPLLIVFADQEEVVGALHIIINQNQMQPLVKEEPIFTLLEQKEYEKILELGFFKIVVIQKELLDIPPEQEEALTQAFSAILGTSNMQGKRPKKGSPGEYEQIMTQEEIEQVLKEQGKENPQIPEDPMQRKTMLYAGAFMQLAQQNPEKIQQALKEDKIKIYKTTSIIHLLKYIPASIFSSIIRGA